MTYKLFIDDERFPVTNDWVIVRSSQEAIDYVKEHGCPSFISFDHDLGDTDTSMRFIWWMIESHIDGTITFAEDFKYYVHSQNPIGAANIKGLLDGFIESEL